MTARNNRLFYLMLSALFTALIIVGTFIRIPLPIMPFTLQTLFTIMTGLLLGVKYSFLSVLLYIVLGLIGLPIFTTGGGLGSVLTPTFGYIISFLISTPVIAYLVSKQSQPTFKSLLSISLIGMFIIYLIGIPYCYLISKFYFGNSPSAYTVFVSWFIMFLPTAILKCIIASSLAVRLLPILKKHAIN